jgi:hypothetical protein
MGSWFRAPKAISGLRHPPGLANSRGPIFPLTGETFDPTFSLLLFKRLNVNISIENGTPRNQIAPGTGSAYCSSIFTACAHDPNLFACNKFHL